MAKFEPSGYGKFRKPQKNNSGRILGLASETGRSLSTCEFGLRSLEGARVTPNQLEAMRKVLVNKLGRYRIIKFRVLPDFSITKKPLAVRMGSGKGGCDHFVAKVRPGKLICEIDGLLPGNCSDVEAQLIIDALESAAQKLSCKTQIIRGYSK